MSRDNRPDTWMNLTLRQNEFPSCTKGASIHGTVGEATGVAHLASAVLMLVIGVGGDWEMIAYFQSPSPSWWMCRCVNGRRLAFPRFPSLLGKQGSQHTAIP
jgi:hypothetical protein